MDVAKFNYIRATKGKMVILHEQQAIRKSDKLD